ncbi:MAG: molybdenum cofactor guanylyltransferase [Thermoprotei archaeon]
MTSRSSYRVVILAGGKSVRFGVDKCSFEWNGLSPLARLTKEFEDMEVIILTDRPRGFPNELLDRELKGPYVAVRYAVKELKLNGKLFVVGCDYPFANRRLSDVLCKFEANAVVPVVNGVPQYLIACYSSSVFKEGCYSFAGCIDDPYLIDARSLGYYGVPTYSFLTANRVNDLILSPSIHRE